MPDHRYEIINPDGTKDKTILTNFHGDAVAGVQHIRENMWPSYTEEHAVKHLMSAPMGCLPQHVPLPDQGGPPLDPRLVKVIKPADPKAISINHPDHPGHAAHKAASAPVVAQKVPADAPTVTVEH